MKTVFITGARRGLGKVLAYKFSSKGFNIVLNDFEEKGILEDVKNDLESKYGNKCYVYFGDISNEEVVIRMLKELKSNNITIDVLINNAAIVTDIEIDNRDTKVFEETMHNNVTGTYLMCKYIGKYMYETKELSRIINVSSTNGIDCNFPTSIDYDASKAAINSLTKNFAIEYAPRILVNAVAPAWMNTEMNQDLPQDLIEAETSKIYLERFAEPEEVANFIYFLSSDENTYINNQIMVIDGGYRG